MRVKFQYLSRIISRIGMVRYNNANKIFEKKYI